MATTAEKLSKPVTATLQKKTGTSQSFFGSGKTASFFAPAAKAKMTSDISGGSALPTDAKEYFKSSLQVDVSDIKIHNDIDSMLATRSKGVRAYADGAHIFFNPSAYSPGTEAGEMLLAQMVSESLKQRSISVPDLDKHLNAGIAEFTQGEESPSPQTKDKKKPDQPADKKNKGVKDRTAGKNKAAKKGKGKKGKASGDGPAFRTKKKDPKKSPATPEEDHAFHRVVKKTKATAKKGKVHDPADVKSAAARKSAKAVPKEAESKAQNRKADGLAVAGKEDKPFNAIGFKTDLLKKITEITPNTLKEATEFKKNNKIDSVKQAMGGKVAQEKAASTGPVDRAVEQSLNIQETDNKKAVALLPVARPGKPAAPSAADSAPKPKLSNEISLKEQSRSVDEEMKANNVTEVQLVKSNEPSFASALDAKKTAQKDAAQKPVDYKKKEALLLTEAKSSAGAESSKAMSGLQMEQTKNQHDVGQQQQTAKDKDEERRATVAKTVDELYKAAETKVTAALAAADKEANTIFDNGSEAARIAFENYVDQKVRLYKIRRYSGFWGGLRWAKDKLFGMPEEVNVFYTEGRKLYLADMDKVITQVATAVTTRLNEAKQAIKDGKKSIAFYVNALPTDLADVGKQAAENIQDKFDTLEQNINDKRDQLIDGLAKKYVDNVKKLDERISEMKEANKGLIDKAIGFLKKVWAVIKSLKELFTSILSKLASIIGTILSGPSKFFSNLGKAFQQGLDNFKAKFTDYLESGLMQWLATNLGVSGVELPEKFTPGALFTMALQIMGLTKVKIRKRAVELLDEEKVSLLETAGGVIYKIYNEGPASIWDMIVEKLSDFKEIVWEAIKSYIKKSIIEAALILLLSMLNPIGAFIKVCIAIYDFLMTLVRFKDRIVELLDSILNAVTGIATGAVDSAAKAIEKAFAKSIPVIIAFLAGLLRLNNIAAKVRDIIMRIQARVEKGIDFVIMKGWSIVGRGVEGVLKLKNKGKALVEKGKDKIISAGKSTVSAIRNWWNKKSPVKMKNGERHTIYLEPEGDGYKLMIQSRPNTYVKFLWAELNRGGVTRIVPGSNEDAAMGVAGEIDKMLANYGKVRQEERPAWGETMALFMDELALLTGELIIAESRPDPATIIRYGAPNREGFATIMSAELLSANYVMGEPASKDKEAVLGYDYAATFQRVSKGNRNYFLYVQGHLLNERFGGPANVINLTPIHDDMNKQHLNLVEKEVKKLVLGESASRKKDGKKAVVNYTVNVEYGGHANRSNLIQEFTMKMITARRLHSEEMKKTNRNPRFLVQYAKRDEAAMNLLAYLTYEQTELATAFDCVWQEMSYNQEERKWMPVGERFSKHIPHQLPQSVDAYKLVEVMFKTDLV